ncbi:hypothetical protein C8R45DRAFT_929471 [Mycena sanguinolenta]|nr:hypothetical protein C8R45DRAFT_929471 [Mycena sanguinolenta]
MVFEQQNVVRWTTHIPSASLIARLSETEDKGRGAGVVVEGPRSSTEKTEDREGEAIAESNQNENDLQFRRRRKQESHSHIAFPALIPGTWHYGTTLPFLLLCSTVRPVPPRAPATPVTASPREPFPDHAFVRPALHEPASLRMRFAAAKASIQLLLDVDAPRPSNDSNSSNGASLMFALAMMLGREPDYLAAPPLPRRQFLLPAKRKRNDREDAEPVANKERCTNPPTASLPSPRDAPSTSFGSSPEDDEESSTSHKPAPSPAGTVRVRETSKNLALCMPLGARRG